MNNRYINIKPETLLLELDISAPPVDVFSVAKSLGVVVNREPRFGDDHSGEIKIKDNVPIIWLNPFDVSTRQRFTLAHEVGHYINDILPHISNGTTPPDFIDGDDSLRRDGRQAPVEYKANDFAARLLMPISFIEVNGRKLLDSLKAEVGGKVDTEVFITQLANLFDVSYQAMEVRLKSLGYINR